MVAHSKDKKLKVMIVDDHPIVRQGLMQLISQEADMSLVGEVGDATEVMKMIKKVQPDLAIVDISLKGTSGIELTKAILAEYPSVLVLIISMYDESLYAERALRAGAKGYLMKQEATDHVITAMRKVMNGEIYISHKMHDNIAHQFVVGSKPMVGAISEHLSDRELEVLQLIGQGYVTRKVADELHVSVKTVESHYANIKAKLSLKNSNELIQYAVEWRLSEK